MEGYLLLSAIPRIGGSHLYRPSYAQRSRTSLVRIRGAKLFCGNPSWILGFDILLQIDARSPGIEFRVVVWSSRYLGLLAHEVTILMMSFCNKGSEIEDTTWVCRVKKI